jgi:amino acid adenylation domain-containing protein
MSKTGNIEAIYPLSPLQEGILFHALYTPQSMGYFEQSSSTLEGELNVPAFQLAWQTIVDRHPILRTLFAWERREQPLQIVRQKARVPFNYQDWRSYPPSEQKAKLEAFLISDRKQGFNLSKAPLMRLALMRLDEKRYQFTWSFHHLLLDGWSGPIVLSEFISLYEAYCRDEKPTLPHRRPYRDYIRWLQEQDLSRTELFWRDYLDGFTKPTPFGVDKPKSEGETEAYANQEFDLPEAATQSLQRMAQQHHLTMSTIVQGVWAILLSRYSNECDVVFGTTLSGRTAPLEDIENMVGLFINTLPLRVEVPPDVSILEWLQVLQTQQTERRLYEHSPLTHIQQWSGLPANVPLFESILVVANYPMPQRTETEQHSLKISDVRVFEQTNFPLTVLVVPGSKLLWQLQYDCHRFDDETITRMLGHIQTILEYLITKPNQRLSELSILTEVEQCIMLVEWNNTQTRYPRHSTLHQLFETQVERTPDDIAVVFGNQQLNYRELNDRANKLANHLKKRGVGPEICVGLCLERSTEMVVAILGILKAGGAYVPLDPEYPSERLAFILSDIKTEILLTQQSLTGQLPDEVDHIICLDTDWATIDQESKTGLTADTNSRNLAYIIYTSGSTGQPKGVMIEHGSLVNYLIWAKKQYMHDGPHNFPFFTTISADLTITSIFLPLISGSSIVVYRETKDAVDLSVLDVFNDDRVDIIKLTPSHLSMIVDQNIPSKRVKRLIVGGEDFKTGLAQRAVGLFHGNIEIYNEYGPTEATVGCMIHRFDSNSDRNPSVAIGKPIDNLQIYLLDADLNPVPIGVKSEIYIAGKGLARGYLNRPELTSKMFISNPFRPGELMYCSGDVGRWKATGILQFLDRIDHQVKIRGFRIELGEIETILSQHPDVQAAVVVVREDPQGEKQLVGYVVSAQEAVSPSELRRHLKQTLPEYMVPAIFMKLDALPLTPNGKVDRRALPVPEGRQLQVEADFVAPRSPYEDAVAEIWRDLLGLEQVGIHDSFFDLGGHSLLAIKIVSRLKTTFDVDITLRVFFDSPTIAGVSATLAMARRGEKPTAKVGILPVARNGTLPLSFAQERFWVLDQFHTNSAVYNGSRGFRLRGPFQLEVFRDSVQALVDHHEILRTTFTSEGGEPHQVIAPTLSVEVPLQNCSGLSKEEQAGMIQQAFLEERRFQFDLAHGPLFRARLLQFAEDDHFLVLNFHHIILDAWSLEVIFKDLVAAYTDGCAGHAVILPALPIQYVDYAHWQRELLEGPIGREQLSFWKTQLAQLPPALPLPTDYARPAVQTFRGAYESLQLSADLLAPLRALNRQEGITLFMVLLATLQFLLHRLTGTHDILVGSPIAGRDQQELHGLIGCFLNTLVLRTDLSGDLTGRDLLQRVREVVLNAYENQDAPFEKVLAEVDPERDLSRTPIFQVLLNMHSFDDQILPLPGLSVSRVLPTDINSLFDMTLYFNESADEIQLSLVYNADLFSAGRMTEFMRQFQSILEQMINDPDRPLEAFTLVTPSARLYLPDPRALLTEPLQTSTIEMFNGWVKRTPQQPALRKGDQTLTYEMLFKRTQILARILRLNGLDRGDVVAVYGPRSLGLIVNMMAVFLSGGVLLPIDGSLPRRRQQLILQEAGAKFLLYIRGKGFEDPWWEQDSDLGVQSLEVDTEGLVRADTDVDLDAVSLPELGIDDAAYIFFTSGTAGVPKGVLGSHKGLSHFLNWQRETFDITPEDRVAHLTSLSFDPVLREIFLPLTSGATLCLPEDINILAANDVLSWLDRERISVLHTVPSLAQSWLTNITVEVSLNEMRWVFFAGESLTENLVNRWQSSFPSAEIVNLYGPAETTLAKCFYRLSWGVQHGVQPLGRPLAQTQALVLSRHNQLCAIGEPGEIVLRTPFRSLGYINNREENRKRFVKNPFRDDEKDQLYYTGDRGRYRPDGMLEFLGRLDDQVKIRGVRVEPNEITVTLARHPEVDSCFVTNKRDEQRQIRLVAYVVVTEQSKTTVSELRAYLKKQLPATMVPEAFVFLPDLPLTPRGKVDRRALPVPDERRPDLEESFAAPRNAVEEALAEIWGEILRIEKVGIQDNFFELGGHSLMATRVISRLSAVYQVEIPLRQFFLYPTIAELALIISGNLEKTEQEHVKQLLDEFENLSDEEAERLLAQELRQNERANSSEQP